MIKTALYADWVLRGSMVALFTLAGAMKLTAHPFEVHGFDRFGYAAWFMYAIGTLEFLGGFALLRGQWVLPTLLLLGTSILGAIGSHLRLEDPVVLMVPAIVAFSILIAVEFMHRPSRATQAA